MALTQRVSGKNQPRTGQTPSAKTIAKLSKAMSDPTKTFYGRSLGRAPDGGAPADYPNGWRFLPANVLLPKGSKMLDGSPAEGYWSHEIYKDQVYIQYPENPYPVATQAGRAWTINEKGKLTQRVTSRGQSVVKALKDLHNSNGNNPKAQKVIDQAEYDLIHAPREKALAEQRAKALEEERLVYATLKMRVVELEKEQTPKRPTPTAPALTSSFPIIPIIIIAVIVGFFLLRRRA